MNIGCSTCFEPFDSRSNISTTPCGHVFHTDCLKIWLQNGQNHCTQCRKSCTKNQIIKLFFSESELENNLVTELMDSNRKLQEKTIELESKYLQSQNETLEAKVEKIKLSNHPNDLQIVEKLSVQNLNMAQELLELKAEMAKLKKNKKNKLI